MDKSLNISGGHIFYTQKIQLFMGKFLPDFFFIVFIIFGAGAGSRLMAQNIVVKVERPVLDPVTERVMIPYRLLELKKHKLRYDVAIYYSVNQGKSYVGPLQEVSGDVGLSIEPGESKQIVWDFLTEAPELAEKGNSMQLKFKIVTRTNEAAKAAYKRELGGPENALLSAFVPGLGDHKVRKGKGYGAITFLTWGALGTGLIFRLSASRNYDKYLKATTTAELDHLFFLAETHKKTSTILITSAIVLWAADVVLVAVKGFQNLKKRRAVSVLDKKVYPTLGLNYNPRYGQPNLSLRLRF